MVRAVIEGVMMKNKDRYAVAVRKPDGEIEVTTDTYKSVVGKIYGTYEATFVRGIFNFVDSLVLGMKTLTWSASFYEGRGRKRDDRSRRKEAGAYGKALDDADDGCIFLHLRSVFLWYFRIFVRSAEEMDLLPIQFGLSLRESSALRFCFSLCGRNFGNERY